MPAHRLAPATLKLQDGIPYADAHGDNYHSAKGGLEQARHVFLGGNGLPQRWQGRRSFAILETGFGSGLNFLATWQAWRDDPERSAQLHYVAIEKHPFAASDLEKLHALWPQLQPLSAQLCAAWPPLVAGFHRLALDEGRIQLTLAFGDVADCLPEIQAAADAFYLDGFAPSKNPGMRAPQILSRLNRLAAPDATLATYGVTGDGRRALMQAGFLCQRPPRFRGKPQMLVARFAPRWQQPLRIPVQDRRAIVIGAGIAGCAACERLAARGWQVTLVERHAQPAREASGNIAGIVMPMMSRDGNQASRLARAAYLYAVAQWRQLGGIGAAFAGRQCGVLQLAHDAQQATLQRAALEELGLPADFVRWSEPADAAALTGNRASHGGWFFPQGGWVTPASLCEAMLSACGAKLLRLFCKGAASLERSGGIWMVRDEAGAEIASAPVVVVAGGIDGHRLPQTRSLPLDAIRGQVTHLSAASVKAPPLVICGDGYVTPEVQGICTVGATYDDDRETVLRRDSQEENLQRLAQLLPAAVTVTLGAELRGRVGFRCVTPDRMPLVGALPDADLPITGSRLRDVPRHPGLYGLMGYGSRGLIWAPFAAELLASMLEGAPLPIERSLVDVIDPARFALKAYRRG
ncbi:bifunctional tRNA (5-methylaminomethyl-2-thiouridine)(34)-methyltransferase MnmD/FAD-dependent 5-carboxymethylaminomethyl-2-thiouridine(34) oxidoreductase MnmC [Noviherbaspirillum sp. CPCC 100848]|uniref:tRNA 5-methylaminomethyl-2-thiouridine biosynthesis bifunctional protein MnmC n=1 Tax=Noviherbaspirillum album TaxID=3080276 RepID=A0ABU6J6C9_9BURK|nr:bifunctional tRNA (5-methylaminomethyl-2-thiouridine)(34)-methyltransferase MnmD/FAD-dependent 5-carboxymethylaminomethyl-2-thiouridine(34) oxidoreductase MnmC [Noviherbaspirillum sp. CPCC 100848]MEC4718842.1 bifunctional tRNA (5-methylaminomethyl-2-thiouridine)(34)-methyltransferase MnmD/FAD-dependent 5-carboxymethylaminomethyl-2-thiouridine(34) oxidoreductase MnmC [Noviherbaspirillum sp. CPCC 100848]